MREPRGAEPEYRRPVVIVQSNEFNRFRISTVIAAAITTNLKLAEAPGNVLIGGKSTGLKNRSVVNVSQLITLNKNFLTQRVGRLSSKQVLQVDEGIGLVLSLYQSR